MQAQFVTLLYMNKFTGVFYNEKDALLAADEVTRLVTNELKDTIDLINDLEVSRVDHVSDIDLSPPLKKFLLESNVSKFFVCCKIPTQASILYLWISFAKGGFDQTYINQLNFFYEIPFLHFKLGLAKQKHVIFDYPNKTTEDLLNDTELLKILNAYFVKETDIAGYNIRSIERLTSINHEDQTFLSIINLPLQNDGIIGFKFVETINLINGIINSLP